MESRAVGRNGRVRRRCVGIIDVEGVVSNAQEIFTALPPLRLPPMRQTKEAAQTFRRFHERPVKPSVGYLTVAIGK